MTTHPRELLYAAASAYRRAGNATVAEIVGAIADAEHADDVAALEKRGGPLTWARRRGQRSSMAAPTRAAAVRLLIDLCERHRATDRDDRTAVRDAAKTIALLAATKLADYYTPLAVPTRALMSAAAVNKRRVTIEASLRRMRPSSSTDPELLAVAVLRGLGLSDTAASNAIKAATKKR
jgi:hypothetical protein